MNEHTTPSADHRGFPRWLKWSLLGALAVLVIGYGAIFAYAKWINDSPDAFDKTDRDAALDAAGASDTATETGANTATNTPTNTPTETPDAETGTALDAGSDASDPTAWTVAEESQVGYRVKEVLFGVDTEAVGRTNQISGEFLISGTQVVSGEFVVDVASITSDESRRDGQFRGRIMSADEFPTATFTLTEPIDIGSESADGVEVEPTANGELTLRGVTNPVTFDVSAEQRDGRIGVLGSIPVEFADYGIANPSFGGVSTEDHGEVEFVLVFEPA